MTAVQSKEDDKNIARVLGVIVGVLIIVELFTQFVWLYPLLNHTARATADCLLATFSLVGIPEMLYSDHGVEFDNLVIKHLVETLLIKHAFALVKSHVGSAEIYCKTVLAMTSKLTFSEIGKMNVKDHWHNVIDLAQFAINSRSSDRNYDSPFFLMFGRNPFPVKDNKSLSMANSAGQSLDDQRQVWLRNWEHLNTVIYGVQRQKTIDKRDKIYQLVDNRKNVKNSIPDEWKECVVMKLIMNRLSKSDTLYFGPFKCEQVRYGDKFKDYFQLFDKNNTLLGEFPLRELKMIKNPAGIDLHDMSKQTDHFEKSLSAEVIQDKSVVC